MVEDWSGVQKQRGVERPKSRSSLCLGTLGSDHLKPLCAGGVSSVRAAVGALLPLRAGRRAGKQ